jgi:hypothetical protein
LSWAIIAAAFPFAVSDEHDLNRRGEILGNVLIEGLVFGDMISLVMGFFPMKNMMAEIERLVWPNGVLIGRGGPSEIMVYLGHVVVDYDDHPVRLQRLPNRYVSSSLFQELAQSRDLIDAQLVIPGPLERCAPDTDKEDKFVVVTHFDFTVILSPSGWGNSWSTSLLE